MDHSLTIPDYDSLDTMVVSEPAQLRALGDEVLIGRGAGFHAEAGSLNFRGHVHRDR